MRDGRRGPIGEPRGPVAYETELCDRPDTSVRGVLMGPLIFRAPESTRPEFCNRAHKATSKSPNERMKSESAIQLALSRKSPTVANAVSADLAHFSMKRWIFYVF